MEVHVMCISIFSTSLHLTVGQTRPLLTFNHYPLMPCENAVSAVLKH